MSWRTSPPVLWLRNIGRMTGVNKLLASRPSVYEDRFQSAISRVVRSEDIVWDVGANRGIYCAKFSELLWGSGHVFAIEPSPVNVRQLSAITEQLHNITVLPIALGAECGSITFEQGNDELGATSRVVPSNVQPTGAAMRVEVATGDSLVASGTMMPANVIKIDTEGYELEVLRGLKDTLRNRDLRALGVEVHFAQLRERGFSNAAAEIEALLVDAGFCVSWTDASHILATRIN